MNNNDATPTTDERPNVVSYPPRRVRLTPEQEAQLSPARKALLIAAASGQPVITRR